MEVWLDIPGYENYYQVSNYGNIRSLDREVYSYYRNRIVKGHIMNVELDKDGYVIVQLSKYGKKQDFKVHRLVASLFIPNTYNKRTVNHKNGIKTDNRVCNLEWSTDLEQAHHAIEIGLANPHHTINRKRRKVKRSDGVVYNSIKEAAETNNLFSSNIIMCCKNKIKSVGGFGWSYYE